MGAKSLWSIGWKSLRVRIAMSDGAWAYVEECARVAGMPVREFLPILIGRGIEYSRVPEFGIDSLPWEVKPTDPVPGPNGEMYAQTTLEELGLTQEQEG